LRSPLQNSDPTARKK